MRDMKRSQEGTATHRWFLQRSWGPGNMVLWIGLNPSKADDERDDATIRKMVGFSDLWGYRQMCVCNLFSLRATDPVKLWDAEPPIAETRNLEMIANIARSASEVVVCWGAPPQRRAPAERREMAVRLVAGLVCGPMVGQDLMCLGRTVYGQPRHPVRLGYATPLELFRRRDCT